MSYKVEYTKRALKQHAKLDEATKRLIDAWIMQNIVNCENPRQRGQVLVGNLSGYWRYRIGDYRLLADIQDDVLVILVIEIAHRRDVYR
jgi:mRNA interferase RelE/StbE